MTHAPVGPALLEILKARLETFLGSDIGKLALQRLEEEKRIKLITSYTDHAGRRYYCFLSHLGLFRTTVLDIEDFQSCLLEPGELLEEINAASKSDLSLERVVISCERSTTASGATLEKSIGSGSNRLH